MYNRIIEICANSPASCIEAEVGGAARVELCAGMPEGGTTPSYGVVLKARQALSIPLHVIIRPRGGDFLYTPIEIDTMLLDIETVKDLGANGVVFGCLTAQGDIDVELTGMLIAAARPMSVTFHRAFDLCRSPFDALEEIVALGCDRLLTSGCRSDAVKGIPMLRDLVRRAGNRLAVMPGCGVRPDNIDLIEKETGAHEFHASARSTLASRMTYRREGVSMGGALNADDTEFETEQTDRYKVAKLTGKIFL
jgi:copper homeostasis protein